MPYDLADYEGCGFQTLVVRRICIRMNQTRVVESKGGRFPKQPSTGATLRGLVQHAWMNAGKPSWDIDRAVREAVKFDIHLEEDLNENPAPAFRENRINNNFGYLRSWVLGCRFACAKQALTASKRRLPVPDLPKLPIVIGAGGAGSELEPGITILSILKSGFRLSANATRWRFVVRWPTVDADHSSPAWKTV